MIEAFALKLTFDEENMWVYLTDGRTLGVPLSFFPRLLNATLEQRQDFVMSGNGSGLHWDALDKDISVDHLLMGYRDGTSNRSGLTHHG